MNNYSPYGSTPGAEYYHQDREASYVSPSPTPSPAGRGQYFYAQTPQHRPATRAHFRHMSSGLNDFPSPRPAAFSPRYTSDGHYATANVSASRSSRKQSFSGSRPKHERRNSYSYYRASDSHGESDEDEYVEINGVTYVLPARSRSKRDRAEHQHHYYTTNYGGGYATDRHYHSQAPPPTPHRYEQFQKEFFEPAPRYEADARRPSGHHRRSSTAAMPARPQTARPSSSHRMKKQAPPQVSTATEADARKHGIPSGYSLKNWDPAEEPIILLGSVFDANSLGKWIYDWTVYCHGAATPMADVAGEMWLLLIQLGGKIKRAEESMPKIRSKENKELVHDFVASGDRLMDKLRTLLAVCEKPMLAAGNKKKDTRLSKNAGVEFVETLFGRERQLEKTETFMQSVRTWNHRFDANCKEIVKNPTI